MAAQVADTPAESGPSAGVRWAGKLRPGGLSLLAWITGIALLVTGLGSLPLFLKMEEYRTAATWVVGVGVFIAAICGLVTWLLPPEVWRLCLSPDGRSYLGDGRRFNRHYSRKAPALFRSLPDDRGQQYRPGLKRLYWDDGLMALLVLPNNHRAVSPEYREAFLRDGPALLGVHDLVYVGLQAGHFSTRLLVKVIPVDESAAIRDVHPPNW